ncbi:MAG: hypothetical protein KU38_06390 [Sulfurovum sp. FS08-3]|nr:MAG: hypothetical protein KU38_06390 [Sulfurovum sp. FS08-3]
MEEFFGKALGVVKGNDGVMPIAIMFVFALGMTLILSKTIKLNQKQSYVMLSMVFVGMMLFLIGLYAMFLKPNGKSEANATKGGNINIYKENKRVDANISNKSGNNTNEARGNEDGTVVIINN